MRRLTGPILPVAHLAPRFSCATQEDIVFLKEQFGVTQVLCEDVVKLWFGSDLGPMGGAERVKLNLFVNAGAHHTGFVLRPACRLWTR